jgi:hypothetical protein
MLRRALLALALLAALETGCAAGSSSDPLTSGTWGDTRCWGEGAVPAPVAAGTRGPTAPTAPTLGPIIQFNADGTGFTYPAFAGSVGSASVDPAQRLDFRYVRSAGELVITFGGGAPELVYQYEYDGKTLVLSSIEPSTGAPLNAGGRWDNFSDVASVVDAESDEASCSRAVPG